MYAKKVVGGIMNWDGSYTQIRFHSGRTDSDFGHNDYRNASGLGPYHWHHKEGPHLHPYTITYHLQNPLDKTKHGLGSAEVKGSNTYFSIKKIVPSLPMTVVQDSNNELQIFTTQHRGNPQIVGDARYRPINIYILIIPILRMMAFYRMIV